VPTSFLDQQRNSDYATIFGCTGMRQTRSACSICVCSFRTRYLNHGKRTRVWSGKPSLRLGASFTSRHESLSTANPPADSGNPFLLN